MSQSSHFQTNPCPVCMTDRVFIGRTCNWCKTEIVNTPETKFSKWPKSGNPNNFRVNNVKERK